MKQFQVIRDFEKALADYTGAPFVTCVNSCTMALRLCLDWRFRQLECHKFQLRVAIPKHTYVSVPIQINRAGFSVDFVDRDWTGQYEIYPLGIHDSARRFHANMFPIDRKEYTYICVSFHYTKILGLGHGGAILHDDPTVDNFFHQMRHDGRTDGFPIENMHVKYMGHHCPMAPEIAAQGLVKLASLPDFNEDLPNSNYPDLSTFEIFK